MASARRYFAPGYGEFSALGGTEFVTVALGLPIDAIAAEPPAELTMLTDVATTIMAEAPGEDWDEIDANAVLQATIWAVYRAAGVPPVARDPDGQRCRGVAVGD